MNRAALPRTVWVLGFVSLLMDISSESIHAILPLFLTVGLGASVALVGLIDGIGEAVAAVGKLVFGAMSDRWRVRKPFVAAGYGLAALTKPLFAIAASPIYVLVARVIDRVAKGVRAAPRDAWLADVTPHDMRGRAFGLRQAMDTAGAVVGPLLALAGLAALAGDMRLVFWIAAIPAALALLLVLLGVQEPEREPEPARDSSRQGMRLASFARLGRAFWLVLGVAVVFTFARFSEAFLVLKASGEGLPLALAPLVFVAMNLVYAALAYPAGALADHGSSRRLLAIGLGVLIAADVVLAFTSGLWGAFAGTCLWGAHLALTQGLFAKLVADAAAPELRGTAFGLFNLAIGLTLLLANLLAGLLWDAFGSQATFLAGLGFSALALGGLGLLPRQRPTAWGEII